MSFPVSKKLMEEGDTVLLYLGYDNFVQMQLERGRVHQTRYGALKHEQLIGAPYGLKVECPKGWVCPLQPTSELWTLALPHRTQILYTPDISMIVLQLYLKPGSVVVEAGTGSGSLSHALIRSVMPTGHLHTFEFHAERCAAASKEFEQHGLADYVTAKHCDVCAHGFDLNKEVDAVFLDLPAPWECISFAKQALRPGGRICAFSPCMEQVQRTCEVLKEHGFCDLTTLECLARSFSVQNVRLAPVDFGDQVESLSDQVDKTMSRTEQPSGDGSSRDPGSTPKVAKTDPDGGKKTEEKMDTEVKSSTEASRGKETQQQTGGCSTHPGQKAKAGVKGREFKTGAPNMVMQGHTGFLTFASLY